MYAFYRMKFLLLIIIVLVCFNLSALAGYAINFYFVNLTFFNETPRCSVYWKNQKIKNQLKPDGFEN